MLVDFCGVVQTLLPREGRFARLGGEEFAAIIPAHAAEAWLWCERIRLAAQLSQPDNIAYSVSIGFAASNNSEQRFEALLALADEALYRAKSSGRNRTEQYLALSTAV